MFFLSPRSYWAWITAMVDPRAPVWIATMGGTYKGTWTLKLERIPTEYGQGESEYILEARDSSFIYTRVCDPPGNNKVVQS